MSERHNHVEKAIREHVAAFNAQDLPRLLAGLAANAVWQTGQDTVRGHAALAVLFGDAFRVIAPRLTVLSLLIDDDRAACELRENMTVDGAAREDFIAGFYRVDTSGVITSAKIYRQGSADV
jgi:hypothetical protein